MYDWKTEKYTKINDALSGEIKGDCYFLHTFLNFQLHDKEKITFSVWRDGSPQVCTILYFSQAYGSFQMLTNEKGSIENALPQQLTFILHSLGPAVSSLTKEPILQTHD